MMWCTRWYLPLVLLPMPIAPPYFLLLFLFSTTMHARPCFYCMVLLTAMFMSTCYWPPVPIETPLVQPWSENVTTFADALHLMMPNLPEERMPSTIPVADRCWCDFSNGFFAPFNATKWDELSVVRLKDSLEKDIAAEKKESDRQRCERGEGEDATVSAACADVPGELQSNVSVLATAQNGSESEGRPHFWNIFRPFKRTPTLPPTNASSDEADSASLPAPAASPNATSAVPTDSREPQESAQQSVPPKPWLRREYDLRQYGFAMVLDFGWPDTRS
ncbi:hypothetical protein BD311DRAFT_793190 [Dichomitus squalens]|uniref:Uncharacterized protein n=1 Tax=Dichomitus squalens TaxID=114155 RepID=A0A4Q9QC35_9APHY|nr:hypothetical protein BD311DRAFT_793190 [Dichomitus squalens]TBU64651.1 hypothetical protein BD310DRAFT_913042 [Dichomitus squalens]